MKISSARVQDIVVALALIAAVALFIRTPFIWIVEFVRVNPHSGVIWRAAGDPGQYWHWPVQVATLIAVIAWKAESLLKGFVIPVGFAVIYSIPAAVVASLLPFYIVGWLPFILAFTGVGGVFYLCLRKLFGKHLAFNGTITEFVLISGSIVIVQFMEVFMISLDRKFFDVFY